MNKFILSALLLSAAGASPMTWAQVDGLDSRTNLKVMKAKRLQAIQSRKEDGDTSKKSTDACAGVDIGNVETGRGARALAPRENTVVVTGDVIVVPGRHCN